MEKAMNKEERIRRAEEIYYRRKREGGVRVSTISNVNTKGKPEYILFKKLILQVLICLVIYLIFYMIKNSNYIFSEDVINKTKEFLSYDINFKNIYNSGIEFYNNNIKQVIDNIGKDNNQNENQGLLEEYLNQDSNTQTNSTIDQNQIQENIINNEIIENTEGGIGGGNLTEVSADEIDNSVNLSQMEIDANEIKSKFNFIVPLSGTITSRYGPRTPTDIVSANHEGIDIGGNEGTIFVAAMEGTVTSVVYGGDYGNHIYIQNEDVVTLYAHCKTIYKTKGENILQGEPIGEVGSTGKATRTTSSF